MHPTYWYIPVHTHLFHNNHASVKEMIIIPLFLFHSQNRRPILFIFINNWECRGDEEGKRWVQVSQKAFSPCCSLLQLSIFNLSCKLPIGSGTRRRYLIGCWARCATQAPRFPQPQCCNAVRTHPYDGYKNSLLKPHTEVHRVLASTTDVFALATKSLTERGSDLPLTALSISACVWHPFWRNSLSLSLSLARTLSPSVSLSHHCTHSTMQIVCEGPHAVCNVPQPVDM